jgi:hypothetical protein
MAAVSLSPIVDFDIFTPSTFVEYRKLRLLHQNLEKGRVGSKFLSEFLSPYLIIKLEQDLIFRQRFLDGIQIKLTNYEIENPKANYRFATVEEFQNQAWSDQIVNFNDEDTVGFLEEYYGYQKSGDYIKLLANYKAQVLSDFSAEHIVNVIDMVGFNFFLQYIDKIFTVMNDELEGLYGGNAHSFLFDLLCRGKYEVFFLFVSKAVNTKSYKFLEDVFRCLLYHHDFQFYKNVMTLCGKVIPTEKVFTIDCEGVSTSKEIFQYHTENWDKFQRNFYSMDLECPVSLGDFQMFQFLLPLIENPKIDQDLLNSAVYSGSPELYSEIRNMLPNISDLENIVQRCVDDNFVDLALWLTTQDPDKDEFLELFKQKLSERSNRNFMKQVLGL